MVRRMVPDHRQPTTAPTTSQLAASDTAAPTVPLRTDRTAPTCVGRRTALVFGGLGARGPGGLGLTAAGALLGAGASLGAGALGRARRAIMSSIVVRGCSRRTLTIVPNRAGSALLECGRRLGSIPRGERPYHSMSRTLAAASAPLPTAVAPPAAALFGRAVARVLVWSVGRAETGRARHEWPSSAEVGRGRRASGAPTAAEGAG